jgi:hypothetical protein
VTTSTKPRKKAKPAAAPPAAAANGVAHPELELAMTQLGKVRDFRTTLSARIAEVADPAPLQAFRQKVLAHRDPIPGELVRDISLKIAAATPADGPGEPLDATTLRGGYVELRVALALEAQLLQQIEQMQQQAAATAG